MFNEDRLNLSGLHGLQTLQNLWGLKCKKQHFLPQKRKKGGNGGVKDDKNRVYFKGKQTFLDATSGVKFCFEITHNARVHVNFSFDFTTTLQSVDSISSEIFAAAKKDKEIMDATCYWK